MAGIGSSTKIRSVKVIKSQAMIAFCFGVNVGLGANEDWVYRWRRFDSRFPGRPSCGVCQALSLSSQIISDPRFLSVSLQADQFVVR